MAKSEGAAVRHAMDGPKVEHDQLIDQLNDRIAEEYARSSDASESGAKMAEFLEQTGLNSQATGWGKAIIKKLPKKDGQQKALDVIRSLELILPMVKNHVEGQGQGDMDFDEDSVAETEPAVEVVGEEAVTPVDEEAAEFNAEVDEVMGDDTVPPLEFGAAG